jgi:hypothetical protein
VHYEGLQDKITQVTQCDEFWRNVGHPKKS